MRFDILTIFPEIFDSFLKTSLIARALKKNIISVSPHNLRRWTSDRHKTVDGRPYGGGVGMVMMPAPIIKGVATIKKSKNSCVILFSAKGKKIDQATARRWSKFRQLIFICGRYEGVDERIAQYVADEEISIGDYVLFGGEVPAMVAMEAVTRLLPDAVAKSESIEDESFKELRGLAKKLHPQFVEYPHYTRPEAIKIKGRLKKVPSVLLTGNHQKIAAWRSKQSDKLSNTRE